MGTRMLSHRRPRRRPLGPEDPGVDPLLHDDEGEPWAVALGLEAAELCRDLALGLGQGGGGGGGLLGGVAAKGIILKNAAKPK